LFYSKKSIYGTQGDQIGRIFVLWMIVWMSVLENDKSSPHFWPNFWATFPHSLKYAIILTNMGWATFWAIFFTNLSGHSHGTFDWQSLDSN
jgi:hypothetical protein